MVSNECAPEGKTIRFLECKWQKLTRAGEPIRLVNNAENVRQKLLLKRQASYLSLKERIKRTIRIGQVPLNGNQVTSDPTSRTVVMITPYKVRMLLSGVALNDACAEIHPSR